jgi:SAM-dependent methyltransferase
VAAARTGDFDYDAHGEGYATQRRADPRIAAIVHDALGDAHTVLNVGAGAGSYEPATRHVVAVEPSAAMRAQRRPELAPAIAGSAESLPFDDDAFDAAMATVTVHQWSDLARGLAEMRRVTRGPVVILTFDADALDRFWLAEYTAELIDAERKRYPPIAELAAALSSDSTVRSVPVPADCTDGFTEAYFARPERFLDDRVRRSQSAWAFVEPDAERRAVDRLRADLASGAWDARHRALRTQAELDGSLRLVVGAPQQARPSGGR